MAEQTNGQAEAAEVAASARRAIAAKIAEIVPGIEDDALAQVVLHLAEAYAHLAAEPPRARAR